MEDVGEYFEKNHDEDHWFFKNNIDLSLYIGQDE